VPETKRESTLEQAPREEMPSRLEPMLAKPGRIPESDSGDWAYEIKWDGIRALGYADHGRWSMLSRRLEDVTARYPELAPLGEALADRAAILDGEVVALDTDGKPRFQLIQSRMGLTAPAAISARATQTPVDYVIFDLLHLDGHRVRDLTYLQRRELLEELGLEGPRWRTPRYRQGGGAGLLEAARRQGLEGIVAKRRQPLSARQAQRRVDQGARLAPPGVRDRRLHPRGGPAGQSRRLTAGRLLRPPCLGAPRGRGPDAPLRRRRRLGAD